MKLSSIGYLFRSGFKGVFSHGFRSFATVTIIVACLIMTFMVKNKVVRREDDREEHHNFVE